MCKILHKGRPPNTAQDTMLNVLLETLKNPHVAVSTISKNSNWSVESVHKILQINKYNLFKVQLVHELLEDIMQFCEHALEISIQVEISLERFVSCECWQAKLPHAVSPNYLSKIIGLKVSFLRNFKQGTLLGITSVRTHPTIAVLIPNQQELDGSNDKSAPSHLAINNFLM